MTGSCLTNVNASFTNDCSSSWLELESDPGLFTLLVDDFGVKGIQVEEVYDLTKPLDNSIYGFIFLFKWIERRNGRRNKSSNLDSSSNYVTDPNVVNKMFFAHQIVPNSCATHALLSVLLNSRENNLFKLGDLLENFKKICEGLAPEMKGLAIGNQPKLAQSHNSYAKPDNSTKKPTLSTSSTPNSNGGPQITLTVSNEIFHFICFVPINGRLYELDGLKPFPVDHGPLEVNDTDPELLNKLLNDDILKDLKSIIQNLNDNYQQDNLNWTNKFKQIIEQRLRSFNQGQNNHEIRFNLMAVVADKMTSLKQDYDLLELNKNLLNNLINDFESDSGSSPGSDDNRRQLRSSKRDEKCVDIYVDLMSDFTTANLINSKTNTTKFRNDFKSLIEKYDLVELVKMYQFNSQNDLGFNIKKQCTLSQLRLMESKLSCEIEQVQSRLNEEIDKRKKYAIEAFRRKHVYNEFIITYLKALAENGKLEEIVRNSVTNKTGTNSNGDTKQTSFFISPKSLFIQKPLSKKQRKK